MHFCYHRTITSRKITFAIRQITQDINLSLTEKTAARSSQEAVMTSHCSEMNIKQDDSHQKDKFSGFRRAKHKHLFSESKPYSTTSYEHVSNLTFLDFKTLTFVSA